MIYNNFECIEEVPYFIFEKILTDESETAENLWKVLKYATFEPLKEDNLTFEEKRDIFWSPDKVGAKEENNFNIFLKPLVPSSLNEVGEQTQLRIYEKIIIPTSNIKAVTAYEFQVFVNEKTCMVLNENNTQVERTNLIVRYLLVLLNGADLGIGSSMLSFDRSKTTMNNCEYNINDGKSIFGRTLRMSLDYINTDSVGGVCNV